LQTYEQLFNEIQKKQIRPVYLLAGEEPFFIDQLTDLLTDSISTPESEAFDKTILYGKDAQASQIIEAAKRFPMMATHQLIVVREAQHLERQFEALTPYVENPQPQTVLVFCYKYKKFDQRKKFFKAVDKKGGCFESKPLYDNKVEPWILNISKLLGLNLSAAAGRLIFYNTGNDLARIYKELEKLKIIGVTKEILPEHIEKHIGFSKEFNNFELVNALGEKNFSKAIHITQHMGHNPKQYPLVVTVSTIFLFFQRLLIYHGLDQKNNAASVLGIKPYFVKDYAQASMKYSMRQCSQIISLIAEADVKSKGVGADASQTEILLKDLIIGIFSC